MADNGHDLPWTEEQWATVQRTAQDAARKARVASSFLPLVGPLPPGQAYVPTLRMTNQAIPGTRVRGEATNWLTVDDVTTTPLITISCNVYLGTTQAEDPELSAALDMICRAAVLVGRLEDAYVFNGSQQGPNGAPTNTVLPPEVVASGGDRNVGLLGVGGLNTSLARRPGPEPPDQLVQAVVDAVQQLEDGGEYGPFACVLGNNLYTLAITPPAAGADLPSKQIVAYLNDGPLLRSSSIPAAGNVERGVVVALAGCPVDLVVGSDVHVTYVQRTPEPRYVLRVSERFVLRIKQPQAVCLLTRP